MPCFTLFFKKKEAPSAPRAAGIDEEIASIQNITIYTYKQLRKATDDFDLVNKVGEGGFGSVYKGKLKDGTLVAVKVLSAKSSQGVQEFLTEINVVANIEHDKLVKLYGCCVEGNHRILVYGYLENNSLAQTLLGGGHCGITFPWHTRRKICIGVAVGLAFLHEEIQPHIIHRDIKASNILLDNELNPKISDFGLAKLFPSHMTHISTRVAGTVGYLAPEYAMRAQLTRKADIYSFGVLILEIVSGRSNTNKKLPAEEQYLLERAWELHEKGVLGTLVDTSLEGDFDADEACRYLKIGLLCIQQAPGLRPSMSTVVKMLTGEIDTNQKKITKPGLLLEFMDPRVYLGPQGKNESKYSLDTICEGSSKQESSASSSKDVTTSFATMTFNSIYDRSC